MRFYPHISFSEIDLQLNATFDSSPPFQCLYANRITLTIKMSMLAVVEPKIYQEKNSPKNVRSSVCMRIAEPVQLLAQGRHPNDRISRVDATCCCCRLQCHLDSPQRYGVLCSMADCTASHHFSIICARILEPPLCCRLPMFAPSAAT